MKSNYTAEAIRYLDKGFISNNPYARIKVNYIKSLMTTGTHFSLPDDGKIFEDNLKGLDQVRLRLPYPIITIECHISNHSPKAEANTHESDKRVILCLEVDRDTAIANFQADMNGYVDKDDKYIVLFSIYHISSGWQINPIGLVIPCDVFEVGGVSTRATIKLGGYINLVSGYQSPLDERTIAKLISEASSEAAIMFEMLEALSCKNVRSEVIDPVKPSVNAKRIAKGKLPLFEIRELIITNESKGSGHEGNGTHSSPRMHLRRGHIRRLSTGNIWVNACVVGSAEKGVISKTYRVSK